MLVVAASRRSSIVVVVVVDGVTGFDVVGWLSS